MFSLSISLVNVNKSAGSRRSGTSILKCSNRIPEILYTYEVVFLSSVFYVLLSFILLFINIILSRHSEK